MNQKVTPTSLLQQCKITAAFITPRVREKAHVTNVMFSLVQVALVLLVRSCPWSEACGLLGCSPRSSPWAALSSKGLQRAAKPCVVLATSTVLQGERQGAVGNFSITAEWLGVQWWVDMGGQVIWGRVTQGRALQKLRSLAPGKDLQFAGGPQQMICHAEQRGFFVCFVLFFLPVLSVPVYVCMSRAG